MGQNNFLDLKCLPEMEDGMKRRDTKFESFKVREYSQMKKQPVTKDCFTRAKEVLDIEHTDVLGKAFPETLEGHCYAISKNTSQNL